MKESKTKTMSKTKINITDNQPTDFKEAFRIRLRLYEKIIEKSNINCNLNKSYNILSSTEHGLSLNELVDINNNVKEVYSLIDITYDNEAVGNKIQQLNNDVSSFFKKYGTYSLEDLMLICIGDKFKSLIQPDSIRWELLCRHLRPFSYTVINVKNECYVKNSNVIVNDASFVDNRVICYNILNEYDKFIIKTKGIKVEIIIEENKKLIVYGILDDVEMELVNNSFINTIRKEIKDVSALLKACDHETSNMFINSLELKDYLINYNVEDYEKMFKGIQTMVSGFKKKQTMTIVKDFVKDELFVKRKTLLNLLIMSTCVENQYLAYLLYDLMSNDTNGIVDTQEQIMIYDSFPHCIKLCFKTAMKQTLQYTTELSNFDFNKVPLEQQICLMNASDNVKEKAMTKYKEVKSKSDDGGTKARSYLEGLLKIPFNIYKREPILHVVNNLRELILIDKDLIDVKNVEIINIDNITIVHIIKLLTHLKSSIFDSFKEEHLKKYILKLFSKLDKAHTENVIQDINSVIHQCGQGICKIEAHSIKKTQAAFLKKWIEQENIDKNSLVLKEIFYKVLLNEEHLTWVLKNNSLLRPIKLYNHLNVGTSLVSTYLKDVKATLNSCVHGHKKAKVQIERIIGQWLNGSSNMQGCVLGFEGNPGVGKTTLAKGLSKCLKDNEGNCRPLSIIAIGGDANASTLVGHSYTYVGSTWGQIVQILMDNKCMNPIIVIDEVDKVSKTEHGREIIGILTHLLDSTQNNNFQDKYFSGIGLDLSKILFVLSYNDPEAIDRIMLDRIHRIQFDTLTVEDKIEITKKHLLPELYSKFSLANTFSFDDDVIKFIIDNYTLEPGVRKLKEKLFEIIGEINLSMLNKEFDNINVPIEITIDDIKNKYFKDKRQIKVMKVHEDNRVGLINALWANQLGQGGVLPLHAKFVPSNKFLDLTLTGSLGDVMKESIQVSLTTAWNLTSEKVQKELIAKYNNPSKNEVYGLHIHCPSISTKKDGPSATTAFTVILYSLFNNIKIKHNFGITGETSFDQRLTEIGGLREKIIHSIPSGLTEYIYPKENEYDFNKIMEIYKDNEIINGIKFHCIETVSEVLDLILEK